MFLMLLENVCLLESASVRMIVLLLPSVVPMEIARSSHVKENAALPIHTFQLKFVKKDWSAFLSIKFGDQLLRARILRTSSALPTRIALRISTATLIKLVASTVQKDLVVEAQLPCDVLLDSNAKRAVLIFLIFLENVRLLGIALVLMIVLRKLSAALMVTVRSSHAKENNAIPIHPSQKGLVEKDWSVFLNIVLSGDHLLHAKILRNSNAAPTKIAVMGSTVAFTKLVVPMVPRELAVEASELLTLDALLDLNASLSIV